MGLHDLWQREDSQDSGGGGIMNDPWTDETEAQHRLEQGALEYVRANWQDSWPVDRQEAAAQRLIDCYADDVLKRIDARTNLAIRPVIC